MLSPELSLNLHGGATMGDHSVEKEDYIDKLMRFIEEVVSANTIQSRNSDDIRIMVEEIHQSNILAAETSKKTSDKIDALQACTNSKDCSKTIEAKYGKTFEELNKLMLAETYEFSSMIKSIRKFLTTLKVIAIIVSAGGIIAAIIKFISFLTKQGWF